MISSEIKLWLPAAKGLNRWTTLSPENDESLHQLRRLIKEENQVFLPSPPRCVRTHARFDSEANGKHQQQCISHWQALKKKQEMLPDGRSTVDIKLLAVVRTVLVVYATAPACYDG